MNKMLGIGHVSLNRWQQAAVALGFAVGTLLDPGRANMIAALGEPTGKPSFERVLDRMKKSPEGRIFSEVQTTGGVWEETTIIKGDAGAYWPTRGINIVQQRPPREFYNRVCK